MARIPHLSDARLVQLAAAALVAIAAWFALRPWLAEPWRTPGSPELYLTGVVGALLLLVPAAFALAKRSAASANPVAWFNAHVWCSSIGFVLVMIHSGGHLRRAPALLLAAIAALAVVGIWARLKGSRRMAATFAARAPFVAPDEAIRARLRELISQKRRQLEGLDPGADEATFSVTLSHLIRRPRLATTYVRLANEESRLLGARRGIGPAQAWWRPLHLLLAWIFMLGVLVHVVTVTFFAGYVADGDPITWWHLMAWGTRW